jgi:hypothetical protein
MHSPALALAWQLWGRHRLGLAVVAAALLTCATLSHALPADTWDRTHAALCTMQFVFALLYVAAAFAFGFECQLEAKESGFPARMFTLPVRTGVLVGWPMLQGMAAVALLWAAWAYFVLRPSGIEAPLAMTALLAAAFVAVLQALLWSPFGLPWVRVLVAVLVLPTLLLSPLFAPTLGATETGLLYLFAALVPAAFVVAFTGVARARRGENPDWQARPASSLLGAARPDERPCRPFSSPQRAQFWFEWRRHFLTFPVVVGCFLLLHLAMILWVEQRPENRIRLGLNFLFFPTLLAPFLGCFLGRAGASAGNPYPLSSFTATRPVSAGTLVAAKLKVAALGTLAAWALVLVAASVWARAAGIDERLPAWWSHLVQEHGAWKVGAALLLILVGLFLITWKLLVDSLFLGLAGRPWIFRGALMAYGLGPTLALTQAVRWMDRAEFGDSVWDALTGWAAGAVLLKLLAAAAVLAALVRQGLVGARPLAKGLACWLLLAGGLFVLARTVVPAGSVPTSLIACGVVLALPLARLAAAPLALAWNRHR